MRRTGIALAAALYIHAATIKVVSASGVGELKPGAELVEFLKPVDKFSKNLVGAVERPKDANNAIMQNEKDGVVVFNSIAYIQKNEDGSGNFFVDLQIFGVKVDGDTPRKKAMVSSLASMVSNETTKQQEMQNIAQRISPFFGKPLNGSAVAIGPAGEKYEVYDKLGRLSSQGYMAKSNDGGAYNPDVKPGAGMDLITNVTSADNTTFIVESIAWAHDQWGFGVISDIDDTIKVTNVLARPEMVKNTFIKDYTPEDGMVEFYSFLKKRLIVIVDYFEHPPVFYYLSSSPWQLFRPLWRFLVINFPLGELILNENYFKELTEEMSFVMGSSDIEDYKLKKGRAVLKKFPRRKFLLIGDSAQRDPEVYGQLYREYPNQIACILIRRVTGTSSEKEATLNQDKRFGDAFKNVPLNHWDLFDKGSDLTDKVDYRSACRR